MKAFHNEGEVRLVLMKLREDVLLVQSIQQLLFGPMNESDTNTILRDSKKLSKRRRLILRDYIKEYALD